MLAHIKILQICLKLRKQIWRALLQLCGAQIKAGLCTYWTKIIENITPGYLSSLLHFIVIIIVIKIVIKRHIISALMISVQLILDGVFCIWDKLHQLAFFVCQRLIWRFFSSRMSFAWPCSLLRSKTIFMTVFIVMKYKSKIIEL